MVVDLSMQTSPDMQRHTAAWCVGFRHPGIVRTCKRSRKLQGPRDHNGTLLRNSNSLNWPRPAAEFDRHWGGSQRELQEGPACCSWGRPSARREPTTLSPANLPQPRHSRLSHSSHHAHESGESAGSQPGLPGHFRSGRQLQVAPQVPSTCHRTGATQPVRRHCSEHPACRRSIATARLCGSGIRRAHHSRWELVSWGRLAP